MSKKHKYCTCEIDEPFIYNTEQVFAKDHAETNDLRKVHPKLIREAYSPCLAFGISGKDDGSTQLVGINTDEEAHILCVGASGSGKSSSFIKLLLITYNQALCVTDIKGELSEFCILLDRKGVVIRPYLIFDPTKSDCLSYDPYYLLIHGDPSEFKDNLLEIVYAIIPPQTDEKDKFWCESEQSYLFAALLYYFRLGLSFIESIENIMEKTFTQVCTEIKNSTDNEPWKYLGEMQNMKDETKACIDRGVRNKISVFDNDNIKRALRGERDGVDFFTWDIIEKKNVFLSIPEYKIEKWSGFINMMYAQLMYFLQRRSDKYSVSGQENVQVLLVMDEIAKFGKLDCLVKALPTLRSKSVNICLVVQSIAQLEKVYGVNDRRLILDNCRYKIIMGANDADTQKCISELIGTHIVKTVNKTFSFDECSDSTGYSIGYSEQRELIVQPHELSLMDDIILLTPYGNCRIDKIKLYDDASNPFLDILSRKEKIVGYYTYDNKRFPVFQATNPGEDGSDIITIQCPLN